MHVLYDQGGSIDQEQNLFMSIFDIEHMELKSENNSYKNIAIYCDDHHNLIEGRDKMKSELR